jgi:hypothetical protein
MKVIEITTKWAVVADHIVDIWIGGDGNKTLNISYDIPDRQKDSVTLNSANEAKETFARVVAELRGLPTLEG